MDETPARPTSAAFDLTESGASTLVRFSFRAIGVVDAAVAEGMTRGWAELVGTRLKALAETGTRLGIDPDEPPSIRPIKYWPPKSIKICPTLPSVRLLTSTSKTCQE